MTDREKVIKGLECCIDQGANEEFDCRECPYYVSPARLACWINLQIDAVELLKAQEPVKPKELFQDGSYYASCGNCGYPLAELTKQHGWPKYSWPPFCINCGREVLWKRGLFST